MAVSESIYKVDESHHYDQGFAVYWIAKAYGPGPTGSYHEYIKRFDDEVTSVRPGDPVAIALHPTKPDVCVMLLKEKHSI